MNNQQLYLAWLRTYAPTVYANALRRATGQIKSLGGLADDLINKSFAPDMAHSFLGDDTDLGFDTGDLTNLDIGTASLIDASGPTFAPIDTGTSTFATPSTSSPSSSSSAGSIFTSILTAAASIGSSVINSSNQSKLVALNTQRAAQGLPPVNAAGQVVTTGFATTSPSMLAFEKAISGGGSSMLMWLLLFGGIGAYLLLRKRAA
jgi:hypothetical protein